MLTYELKKVPANYVIVEVGKRLEDTVKYGESTFYIDPEYNPTQNIRIFGRVVAVPDTIPINEYGEQIEPEVQVGDTIYFHYLSIHNEDNCIYGNFYRIPYQWIFCTVRDKSIKAIGGWNFLEQVVEEDFNQEDIDGKKIEVVRSSSGLITSVTKKTSTKYAVLRHKGTPLRGKEELPVHTGDKVVLNKHSNFKNTIEGREYYTVKSEDILCRVMTEFVSS